MDDFPDNASTEGRLPLYGYVTGTIESADDHDWFKVDLNPNYAYRFTLETLSGATPYIGAWNDSTKYLMYSTQPGAHYYHADLEEAMTSFTAGTYYLDVFGQKPGSYRIGVSVFGDDNYNTPAYAAPLSADGKGSGNIDYNFDQDWFSFTPARSGTYTVTVTMAFPPPAKTELRSDVTLREDGGGAVGKGAFMVSATSYSYEIKATAGAQHYVSAQLANYSTAIIWGMLPYSVKVVEKNAPPVLPQLSGEATVNGNWTFKFSEPLRTSLGAVTIKRDGTGETVQKFEAGDARLSLKGDTLVIDPGAYVARGKYYVELDAMAARSSAFDVKTIVGAKGQIEAGSNGKQIAGADAALYQGKMSDYSIAHGVADGEFALTIGSAFSGTVKATERLLFTGSADVFATHAKGNVGQAYSLYRAAFDRAPDKGGLGFWVDVLDKGTSLNEVAQNFIASQEFQGLYGAQPSNAKFVEALYQNVLHRAGEAGGVEFWNKMLDQGVARSEVLVGFSTSAENQEAVAKLVGAGFSYTAYGW